MQSCDFINCHLVMQPGKVMNASYADHIIAKIPVQGTTSLLNVNMKIESINLSVLLGIFERRGHLQQMPLDLLLVTVYTHIIMSLTHLLQNLASAETISNIAAVYDVKHSGIYFDILKTNFRTKN